MNRDREELDERRRRLFRRMEWVFVYAPPLLAVAIALGVGAFLAWFVRIEGTTFLLRWGMGVGLILGLPLIAYLVRAWWQNR
jgi:hypothetical protein